jgi:NADH-ubiquinone oxidoreductase chain 4
MSLIPILLLILTAGSQPERLSAGSYLLFYTTAVSVPYLVIILLIDTTILGINGNFLRLSTRIVFILTPFFIKIPILGFHFWLPKAHVEARTGGSIILAGILLKLGRYGAARVIGIFYIRLGLPWGSRSWILLAGFSRMITLIQRDIKKLVAYSRVTHITFIIIGLISRSKIIFIIVVIVSLAHG